MLIRIHQWESESFDDDQKHFFRNRIFDESQNCSIRISVEPGSGILQREVIHTMKHPSAVILNIGTPGTPFGTTNLISGLYNLYFWRSNRLCSGVVQNRDKRFPFQSRSSSSCQFEEFILFLCLTH